MASRSLGQLTLDLIAKTGGFTGPLDKAARDSQKRMTDIKKAATDAGKAIGATIGVGAASAAAALVFMVEKQREVIDSQAKMAQRLRTSYESLETLGRAGELAGVGMDKIEGASRALEQRLGLAIQGSKEQAAAFERLGLSAEDIAKLPLDKRISQINQALRDNVQASERAAVAGKLFGEEGATAIQALDPGTIAEAARQVEIFGLNLSDVDAAKVEMANDALSTFGLLGDGIAKQLTVELAPILKAVGDEFLKAAEEAGGLGTVVQDTTGDIVEALSFVVDAADGVKRVFEVVADGIIAGFSEASSFVANNAAGILDTISYLPGVDYSDTVASLRQFATESNGIAREAVNNIEETLNRPLAGQAFKQFYADAQAAAEAAASATVAGREAAAATGLAFVASEDKKTKAAKQTAAAIASQIKALELQAATLGMTTKEETLFKLALDGATQSQLDQAAAALDAVDAFEKAKKQQEDYKAVVSDLRTEEEQLTDQLKERLRLIEAMPDLPEGERRKQTDRAIDAAFAPAPQFAGLDPSVGGPIGEIMKVDTATAELETWYSKQLEILEQSRKDKAELNEEWDAKELELKAQHEQALADLESARQIATLAGTSSFFGNLSNLAKTFYGEQSGLYQATFAAQQALAIAQTIMNTEAAAAAAMAPPPIGLGPKEGAVYAQFIRGMGYASAGIIGAQTIAGMAHDGIDSVPATGTWLLEKGERVTTAETSAKLDRTLAEVQAGMSGRSGKTERPIQITNNFPSMTNAREAREASASIQRAVARGVRGSTRYD
ncbi:hypothetical protein [Pseudomonas sp. Q1-7]|uniref:hypothetical protein n=1 Tax=Pseudomonas sp. Q1-7 TaxID=3020843 RepID=UPI0023017654|nr:hypothetical protein [Pseudomonas sp. Q1-7]